MEKLEIKKDISYKSFLNEKNEEDFKSQIISTKLSIRKKKLLNLLMQKRKENISLKKQENKNIEILPQISILIHKDDFENINSGLIMFYDYLINSKLEKENIKYIFENIYYRLLDIIISEKSFVKNKHMNNILYLIKFLTTENNVFIGPLTDHLFLSNFKKIIEINFNNNIFINEIIPLLSDMLIDKKRFIEIMDEIDVIKIIKKKLEENNNDKENIEKFFLLLNNFIMNINKDKTHKFKFILEYILNFINNNDIINNIQILNNNDYYLIMISLFDILIDMSKDQKNMKIINKSICFNFIKKVINNTKVFNSNVYLIKSYELLSSILMNSENLENKKNIITYIYNNISNELPFVNELYEEIKKDNKSFIYILINCIVSFVNNCPALCELYCFNNNFLNILFKLLLDNKIWKKIKNEIVIFFINIIENDNVKIYKYLIDTELFPIILSYISRKIKTKKESTKIIIYNILYFISNCLLIDEKNKIKKIISLLDKYKFKDTLEILIENKNESISDICRSIFIKYFSEAENIYQSNNNNLNNNDMIIE